MNYHIETINKIYIAFIIILIFTVIYAFFDHNHWNGIEKEDDRGFKRLFNRLYYSMVSWSTVGYGDITPKTVITRTIFIVQVVILLLLAFVW